MVKERSTQNDSLLAPWLQMVQTGGDEAAELTLLIEGHIKPVIRSVIRFTLRLGSEERADEADISQESLAQWLAELRKLSVRSDNYAINDVRGLAAAITRRVCYGWLRRRSPRRHALRNRLQYVLTRQSGLALWTNTEKLLIAGFVLWQGRTQVPSDKIRQLAGDEKFLERTDRLIKNRLEAKLLTAIFDYVGGPIAFDDLVSVAAELLQIKDELPVSIEEQEETGGSPLKSSEDVAWQVEKRIFLQRLWEEVRKLPLDQRAALLLNLRGADGRGCLALFQATGVATLRQIAEVLKIPPERFAEMWPQLPFEDATIAELLHLTRQQVINLRKSARKRLERQLKGFF